MARALATAEDEGRPRMLLSACKLSREDVDSLQKLFESNDFFLGQSAGTSKGGLGGPCPSRPWEAGSVGEPDHLGDPVAAQPPWVPQLCWNREAFAHTAMAITVGSSTGYYKLLFATQNPLMAVFSPMVLESLDFPASLDKPADMDKLLFQTWVWNFRVDWATALQAHELGWTAAATVAVLWGLVHTGGN